MKPPCRSAPGPFSLALILCCVAWSSSVAQTIITHDPAGNRASQAAAVGTAPPTIAAQPTDQFVKLGETARFSVVAGGEGPFTYQWFKDATPLGAATSDTLQIINVGGGDFTPDPASTPKYSVQVTNAHGTVTSAAVGLYEDSIGAGLPNWWRQTYFGTLGAVSPGADDDGDGITNGQEFADGTSPTDASSRFGRLTLSGPAGLLSKHPLRSTHAGGDTVNASAASMGDLQFGGWTGSYRSRVETMALTFPGSSTYTADVMAKALYGSMPVQTLGTDPEFANSNGAAVAIQGFATSLSGQWIAFGSFNRVNGQAHPYVARILADGTLDAGFAPNPDSPVTAAQILPDGKIVIAGSFTNTAGQPRPGVARFHADGALDTSFAPADQGANVTQVACMKVQGDGKVLLGGNIWTGAAFQSIARLNADGSLDATFTTVLNGAPTALQQQTSDGRILLAGNFTQVNGTTTSKLVRLNLDGTLDASFAHALPGGAVTAPTTLLVQPDGKVLAGGSVQVRLGASDVFVPVARFNADGTLDSAFTQKVFDFAGNVTFNGMALQEDGKTVAAGSFSISTPSLRNAVRLHTDGSVDADCFAISRPNAAVNAISVQADGSMLLGGAFTELAVGEGTGNYHGYFLTSGKAGYRTLETGAVKLGGHLISINNAVENNYLIDTLLPSAGLSNYPVWIGLSDQHVESLFAWTTGEPVGFTYWNPGEPSNLGGENYGMINWNKARNGGNAYTWDDTVDLGTGDVGGNSQGPYYGMMEVDPARSLPDTGDWVAGRDLIANEKAGSTQELTNPNATVPQWSYGTRTTLTGATLELSPFVLAEHTNSTFEGWFRAPSASVQVNAGVDPVGVPSGAVRSGEMMLHPPAGGYSVVRWTSPAAATYSITAFWQDVDWNSGDGGSGNIVKNGTEVLFTIDFDNNNGAFTNKIAALNAGDVIEFMLGARGSDTSDTTRFNATITKVQSAADVWMGGRDLAANEKPDGHANETANPNATVPAWSYGHRSSLVSRGLDLYVPAQHYNGTAGDPDMEGWLDVGNIIVNTGSAPFAYNYGFGPNLAVNPEEMLTGPSGHSGPYPVVRWTAPSAGQFDIMAVWQDSDFHGGNGFTAHLLVNGAQIYGQTIDNAHGDSEILSLRLKTGDQLDFLIGTRGDYSFDVTKFNVNIAKRAGSTPGALSPGTLTLASSRTDVSPTSTIDWSNAGANNTNLAGNPFTITSSSGATYVVSKNTTGAFNRRNQGAGWAGNFAPGDALLTHLNSDGPVLIEAANADGVFSAAGMQVQSNQGGPFTATIRAYDVNGALLGTFTANGTSNGNADNTAVFVGVESTQENIHAISIDTDSTSFGGDFAINQVSIRNDQPVDPLSMSRRGFARLVTTNHLLPGNLAANPVGPIFASAAPVTLSVTPDELGVPITYTLLERSSDGVTYETLGYGNAGSANSWSFPVTALGAGTNYFRTVVYNANQEKVRSHATGPLITPPAVTSSLTASGTVGQPFTYVARGTGRLTGYNATGLPAWATAAYEPNSGALTISGTPDTASVTSVTLVPANEAGNGSATLTLTVHNAFADWQSFHFTTEELQNASLSGPLGDFTGEGVANLIKYALGLHPKQRNLDALPTASVIEVGGSSYLALTYKRDRFANVTCTPEVSGNVQAWNSGPIFTTEVSRTVNPDGTETVVTRDNTPMTPNQRRFIRLRVVLNE